MELYISVFKLNFKYSAESFLLVLLIMITLMLTLDFIGKDPSSNSLSSKIILFGAVQFSRMCLGAHLFCVCYNWCCLRFLSLWLRISNTGKFLGIFTFYLVFFSSSVSIVNMISLCSQLLNTSFCVFSSRFMLHF